MKIRLATTRDLCRLTDITVSSLQDDPTYDYMWPHRFKYPDDNSFFWNIHLKEMLYDPRMVFLVVELDDSDADGEKQVPRTVISYGIWERIGSDAAAKKRARAKNTWGNLFDGTETPHSRLQHVLTRPQP